MSESQSFHEGGASSFPDNQDDAGETSSFPKADMHLRTSILSEANVSWIAKFYGIPADLNPRPAPKGSTVLDVPDGAIALYLHFFKQGGFRIPASTFLLRLLKYFCVHITQLVPLGINRATIFEMYCRALGFEPTVLLFRVFYKLCKQGNWFSFQSRGGKNFRPCLKEVKSSLKKWKSQFFLVDRRAIPIPLVWRHLDSDVSDPTPLPESYDGDKVARLREFLVPVHKPHPSLLYAAGLSSVWKHAGHRCVLKGPGGDGNIPLYVFVLFLFCNFFCSP